MLCSNNVQEVMDFALIAQAATLRSRIPFLHFFDGFRTSHEVQKVEELTFADMRTMIDDDLVNAHRARGLSPDRPVMRGTAQNPDVYFQGRETVNHSPRLDIVQKRWTNSPNSPAASTAWPLRRRTDAEASSSYGFRRH
jgi:pyruvate-ferredoxin/flavodoxin oxidoreductase